MAGEETMGAWGKTLVPLLVVAAVVVPQPALQVLSENSGELL